jgi:hypothetical protein
MSSTEVRLILSPRAYRDWQKVSEWVEKPMATVIAQHLEEHHRGSEFKQLMERVNQNEQNTSDD